MHTAPAAHASIVLPRLTQLRQVLPAAQSMLLHLMSAVQQQWRQLGQHGLAAPLLPAPWPQAAAKQGGCGNDIVCGQFMCVLLLITHK
jgi:hypothetical protein